LVSAQPTLRPVFNGGGPSGPGKNPKRRARPSAMENGETVRGAGKTGAKEGGTAEGRVKTREGLQKRRLKSWRASFQGAKETPKSATGRLVPLLRINGSRAYPWVHHHKDTHAAFAKFPTGLKKILWGRGGGNGGFSGSSKGKTEPLGTTQLRLTEAPLKRGGNSGNTIHPSHLKSRIPAGGGRLTLNF